MADRIASFLFDNAIVLTPAIVLACALGIAFVIRRWPKRIWTRILACIPLLIFVILTAIAGVMLYWERNIRSIIEHRVTTLTLRPINGAAVTRVADLRGKVVLVNFWATWCASCRAEMPDLNRLAGEYRRNEVAILTITDETPDLIDRYQHQMIPLHTIVATFTSDRPHTRLEMATYSGRPTTVILDDRGRVRDIFIGRQSYEKLQRALERELRRHA